MCSVIRPSHCRCLLALAHTQKCEHDNVSDPFFPPFYHLLLHKKDIYTTAILKLPMNLCRKAVAVLVRTVERDEAL